MNSFSVLSWNVQGASQIVLDFKEIAPILDREPADIICLQELPSPGQQLSLLKNCKEYDKIIHEDPRDNNAILSKFVPLKKRELSFPRINEEVLPEKALAVDLLVGEKSVRVYNCHLEIAGVGMRERHQQLGYILQDADKFDGPVIICGDMNTTIPREGWRRKVVQWFHQEPDDSMTILGSRFAEDERHLFLKTAKEHGFSEAFDLRRPTWSIFGTHWELFGLKLDWFLARGLKIESANLGGYVSDHRPLWVKCSFD